MCIIYVYSFESPIKHIRNVSFAGDHLSYLSGDKRDTVVHVATVISIATTDKTRARV